MKYLIIPTIILLFAFVACESNKDALITIHTEYGDMKAILYDETPIHKENFIELARSGKYDSTTWHRVIKDFMIQGGDVYAKEGTQEPEEERLPAEIVDGFYHTKGALAAARQPDQQNPQKMSSSVQFYIVDGRVFTEDELTTDQYKLNNYIVSLLTDKNYDTLRQKYLQMQSENDMKGLQKFIWDYKGLVEEKYDIDLSQEFEQERLEKYTTIGGAYHLDGDYTIFGRIVEGLEVIDRIAAVETGRADRPVQPTYLTMEVEMVPKPEITKKYGYEYPDSE